MTHKDIAERLREEIQHAEKVTGSNLGGLLKLADEIDPPKPAPGTLVWWRDNSMQLNEDKWEIGEASYDGVWAMGSYMIMEWDAIEYKPARILAPDEVAVKRKEAERMQRDD